MYIYINSKKTLKNAFGFFFFFKFFAKKRKKGKKKKKLFLTF
jgi:hypothetical protein